MTATIVIGALLILALSATLSAAETAALSVSETRLRTLQDEGFAGATALAALRDRSASLGTTVLVLNTLGDLTAAGLLLASAVLRWGLPGAIGGVPVTALVILVFGEILPRGLASRHPVRFGLRTAPLLVILERVLRRGLSPVIRFEGLLARRPGDDEEVSLEERELREIAEIGQEEGIVGEDEHRLVERAFHLDELTVWDAMTPRVEVFALSESLRLEEVVHQLETVPFSRVPVYGESIDDVTGILSVREGVRDVPRGPARGDAFSFVAGAVLRPRIAVAHPSTPGFPGSADPHGHRRGRVRGD